MNLYELPKLQELYVLQSRYAAKYQQYGPADLLFQRPGNAYSSLKGDRDLLNELLTPASYPESQPLAYQVFGNQLRQEKLSLKHLAALLHERSSLYTQHVKEIDHRLMKCHESLSIAKMLSPHEASRHQMNLERLLLQLEDGRRQEQINFWKDSSDLRQKIFEAANEYQATRNRSGLLESLEVYNA